MSNQIDFTFISKLEGGQILKGYVPNPKFSKSGVTVATGFDLGQRSSHDLTKLGLPQSLVTKLRPYLGLKQNDAERALKKTSLTISSVEASTIDKAVKKEHIAKLILKYNSAKSTFLQSINSGANLSSKGIFAHLPPQAQTVIASVSFQYGVNLDARTPKFWDVVVKEDWIKAIKILKNFGDMYPTRRKKEAKLLESIE